MNRGPAASTTMAFSPPPGGEVMQTPKHPGASNGRPLCGAAAPGKENRWEDQPWLLSRLGSY
jgi:hypothetical protein